MSPGKKSADEAGLFMIKSPAGNEELHRNSVIAGTQAHRLVSFVRLLDFGHVDFEAEAGFVRYANETPLNFVRRFGEALAILPDPVGVDRRYLAWRGGTNVGEHGERNIKVVVRMRAPGEAEHFAQLRDTHRALHGPEVRVGKRNVDRLQ